MSTSIVRQLAEQHGRIRHAPVISGCRFGRARRRRRGPALRRRLGRHVGRRTVGTGSRSTAAVVSTTAGGVTLCFRRVLTEARHTMLHVNSDRFQTVWTRPVHGPFAFRPGLARFADFTQAECPLLFSTRSSATA